MAELEETWRRESERRTRYGDDIVALAEELKRLKESKIDVVASTTDLKAVPNETNVKLDVPGFGQYPLTRHGHEQVAEKTGIPFRYYEKCMDRGFFDLVATNVNRWMGVDADKRLVRIADGHVRALLSDRYRVMDNYDLAFLTMERAQEHGAVVQRCDLTELRMYVKLIGPEAREFLEFTPEEKAAHTWHKVENPDTVVPGLVISNSEVGEGRFTVEPFVFREACSNGLILENTIYKVHLGSRMELGEIVFTDETRRKADDALWSETRDVIDATFDTKVFKAVIAKLRDAREHKIEKPKEVLDAVVADLEIPQERREDLVRYFAKEGETVFGLVNGITRLAQDMPNYEDQIRLERAAGKILAERVA